MPRRSRVFWVARAVKIAMSKGQAKPHRNPMFQSGESAKKARLDERGGLEAVLGEEDRREPTASPRAPQESQSVFGELLETFKWRQILRLPGTLVP